MARPTIDSIYLARRIEERWKRNGLTPAALQKLANAYGAQPLEDALRELHGFPPSEAIRSPYAYLETMLASPTRSSRVGSRPTPTSTWTRPCSRA